MDIEQLRDYCISKQNTSESFPFGADTLVFKVSDKIFLLTSLSKLPLQFNVKCEPEKALQLREEYPAIIPGYHMNKKYWNTIIIDGSLSTAQLKEQIDHSYNLIVGATKKSSSK